MFPAGMKHFSHSQSNRGKGEPLTQFSRTIISGFESPPIRDPAKLQVTPQIHLKYTRSNLRLQSPSVEGRFSQSEAAADLWRISCSCIKGDKVSNGWFVPVDTSFIIVIDAGSVAGPLVHISDLTHYNGAVYGNVFLQSLLAGYHHRKRVTNNVQWALELWSAQTRRREPG